ARDDELTTRHFFNHETLTPFHLESRRLVVLRNEYIRLEVRAEVHDVERSALLNRVADRVVVEIELTAERIGKRARMRQRQRRENIDILRRSWNSVQRARQGADDGVRNAEALT